MKTIDLLIEMQKEGRVQHEALVKVVLDGFANQVETMSKHSSDDARQFGELDRRLQPVETMRRTMRYAAGAVFVQFLVFLFALAAYAMHTK